MNGREDYIRRQNQVQRPSINFTKRDDVRDLMKSPMGQNYGRMMDLQGQALRQGGFDRGDPRVAELKDARRQYNRHDKYRIGNLMGYKPLDVQEIYRQNSGVLREHAGPTYKEMYPISDIAHQVAGSGGLTGMLIQNALGGGKKLGKNFFDDLRGLGSDIASAVGITGAVDDTPEEQDDYVAKTFGFYPSDVHPGVDEETIMPKISLEFNGAEGYTAPIEETLLYDENILPYLPPFIDKNTRNEVFAQDVDDLPVNTINNTRTISGLIEPVPLQEDFREQNFEGVAPEPIEPLPFDDSGREAGIAALYGQGPKFGTTNRRYENEYRDFLASMSDTMRQFEPVTYEEFAEAYERMYQGKPQIGFR